MDPNQIARLLASGDKEQIKEAQRQLQALGHYSGKIDGALGKNPSKSKTMAAAQAYAKAEAEREALRQQEEERRARIELLRAEGEAETGKAEAAKGTAEAAEIERLSKARAERNKQAESGWGIATQIGANVAAPALGTALGMGLGAGTNRMLDMAQESRNRVLQGVAADRTAGLTTRTGAQEAARASGAAPMGSPALRTTARMLPHLGLGALSIGKGLQTLDQQDPDAPFYADMANRAAGMGYIGAGAGLAKQGLRYGAAPGVAPDAQALAVINSNQLRRNPAGTQAAPSRPLSGETIPPAANEGRRALPAPPPETPPASTTAAPPKEQLPNAQRLRMAAEAARGGKVKSGLKKEAHYNMMKRALKAENMPTVAESLGLPRTADRKTILDHARSILKLPGKSSVLLPFAIGSYMAASGDAEAADGSIASRAGNAAADFATGAGAAYGGMKAYDALARAAPTAMRALGSGAAMAMPGEVIGGMTDQFASPEARNIAARNLPEALQFGAVNEAREMAQVPPRSPANTGPRISRLPDTGGARRDTSMPEGADADVARAYRKSPRRTIIELSRSSGLDANDIAMLAGVAPDEVASVMNAIPQRAMEMRASP